MSIDLRSILQQVLHYFFPAKACIEIDTAVTPLSQGFTNNVSGPRPQKTCLLAKDEVLACSCHGMFWVIGLLNKSGDLRHVICVWLCLAISPMSIQIEPQSKQRFHHFVQPLYGKNGLAKWTTFGLGQLSSRLHSKYLLNSSCALSKGLHKHKFLMASQKSFVTNGANAYLLQNVVGYFFSQPHLWS